MAKNRISPHDRFIRSMMTHPQVIKEFFEVNLPENVKTAIDFSSIEPCKESYIDDKLRAKIVDLLYSVNFNGEQGYLYLLLEHASTPDKLLPFRMLKYMVAIMDHHLINTKSKKLPIIYPLILYTGQKPFKHSMDLFDLFGHESQLAKEILTTPYQLIDLTQMSDEELKVYHWFRTTALLSKHIHDKDIIPALKQVLNILKTLEEHGETDYIYTVITYIVEAGEVPDKEEFVKTITKGFESIDEEKVMKIYEMFAPEVFQRGEAKGEAKAWQNFTAVLGLLKLGVSIKQIQEKTGLSYQIIEELKKNLD